MPNTSQKNLKHLAALVWVTGFVVLFIKSGNLLIEAERTLPDQPWIWLTIAAGVLVGGVKAKYLFSRLCRKNLKRIDSLLQPKIWNFYRLQFFIFLFTMIFMGAYLSQLAHGNYYMLLTLAGVELSVATALLGSCYCFWSE
ncbi:MAG: hypothetical protein RPV21_04110 [Candidatus Sedimenticola sp. (ex Thyasira tokunagai)]